MAIVEDLFKASGTGLLVGVAIALTAPVLLPVVGAVARPVAREAIKGMILLRERGKEIAAEARDTYSRLLAGARGLAFFVYVIVNGGMISGLLPVVGVPMPLLSYGGTSAVSLLAGLGVVMAVNAHRPTYGT